MINKLKKSIFVIFILFIVNSNLVFAESNISNNGGINFKRITVENGLSQITRTTIFSPIPLGLMKAMRVWTHFFASARNGS